MTLVDGPRPDAVAVTVWWLEMTDPTALCPARPLNGLHPVLEEVDAPDPVLARRLYQLIGGPWHWVDRLGWSDARWLAWVDRPEHSLVTCRLDDGLVGYYELDRQGTDVEIVLVGLVEEQIGRGLGGWLVAEALRHAWSLSGVRRVWLHTCSLDGPGALANYRARGMVQFDETTEWRVI